MSLFNTMNISASGLTAQRLRLDIISENIANINTTRTLNGGPYRRKDVVLAARTGNAFDNFFKNSLVRINQQKGVKAVKIVEDPSPFIEVYNPSHPDADENGIVKMPNVEIVQEMVNMISASRAYEANITALNNTKSMALKALEIGR
ncbi:flagellar basal-body rod protein FlgC [Anaerobranca californiensis DSM 14826]|uniref:Flagellar basal-body rod protein FlgC n=1 Tax=Anaerobranca californiensis DSM 14826 TaxID=1120989 RepID=A0A1M6KJP2_9FIRM|nr:flagellar basal body rod protein FlgC [Anaerobranca californiensis]SHJ59166.1 flagellar basal-body rod protein FlgC [Anaerobranca californiensis DSM 14826]